MSLRRLLNVAYAILTEGMDAEQVLAFERKIGGSGAEASPKRSRDAQRELMAAMGLAR